MRSPFTSELQEVYSRWMRLTLPCPHPLFRNLRRLLLDLKFRCLSRSDSSIALLNMLHVRLNSCSARALWYKETWRANELLLGTSCTYCTCSIRGIVLYERPIRNTDNLDIYEGEAKQVMRNLQKLTRLVPTYQPVCNILILKKKHWIGVFWVIPSAKHVIKHY